MRASFTGELGYRLHTPNHALDLWKKYFIMGKHMTWFLRNRNYAFAKAEKGYVVIGQETGTVTPLDLNFNWMIGKRKKILLEKDH